MNNKISQSLNHFAYDFSGLNQLKRNVANGSAGSIRQVAEQFETLFINMMMQSMRKAVPESGLFNHSATQLFTSMFDQQIAQQAAGKGFGLADIITKQLSHHASPSTKINLQSNTNNTSQNLSLAQSLFSDISANISPQALGQMLYRQHKTNLATNSTNELSLKTPIKDGKDEHIVKFVTEWLEPAKQAAKHSGIPYEIIIAQAALETGWGQKQIKTENNQSSHNYFGIKATRSWQGGSTQLTTQEFINNKMIKIKDQFRVYNSKQHALTDYINLLTNNPRYRAVVNALDARTAAKALQEANYATDPNYSDKLIQIIGRIEQIAQNNPPTKVSGFRQIAFN
ncbi:MULTISPECIES: flagellar assembly peptidoglycan hydrolase FlgJ [unclassified Gilliamella]|uniref:flagellar assembly peptidoglycan hydrolase FlgJ n=1 Tax=unclassified Gilliamella TaxID=2685620 RepID=UPI00130583C3|nr:MULTISPECIES: flagellar assembly peptidoglycan hydrolase FlgJ [unclassified Gilliamella]MWP49009.1 flagellar assembly peptidoglycan hydrolase FlgJ [Gilliamella sp. Lep-s35]MWP69096.1 flagellar assembly peptidoglycan hydrolase FlgJ [Gilliamella sp. Lep-s5]MWP77241.1 flagellar assembly peptidoglycan hydrolase FlgJ [Gilliamella sp. Lep-s21]